MIYIIQRNFLFIWVTLLLAIAIVLTLTLGGCGGKTMQVNTRVEGKATSTLNQDATAPAQTGCYDSDGGIEPNINGEVTANGKKIKDKCFSPFLIEYYCENGKVTNKNIRCECSKGKCETS